MANYFNTLPLREQLAQLGKCEFMDPAEFTDGVNFLKGKKLVVIGCGSQGLNQGLNLRDSGLDVSYALREAAIKSQRQSCLTPDKQHSGVVAGVVPLMKKNACLAYSHGFNIVEEGMQVRPDLTVIMVAPKCPGTEVREEYKRGFGVPTLIAVHEDNDPHGEGLAIAKAYAAGTGGHKAGVLMSSFIAEVKSDLMGEQTILCGMLQTGSLLCFDKMVEKGIEPGYAAKLVQFGWETVTEALKHGGITNMMDRLSNPAKIKAFELSEELKDIMRPLYNKHMDDIMAGRFSSGMMEDWANDDAKLLGWRKETGETSFEKAQNTDQEITEQEFFDHGILMVAMVRAGVELAFETMTAAGIKEESAYYESLHETPLIANTIARKKLYEMNATISDTAEYGCYLYNHACLPLLSDFMTGINTDVIGRGLEVPDSGVDNQQLIEVNTTIRNHPVEAIGQTLRGYMSAMKRIN
jgi:ketol-acid reductoisomerase